MTARLLSALWLLLLPCVCTAAPDASSWEQRAWSEAAAGEVKDAQASFQKAIALSSAAPSWTALLGSGALFVLEDKASRAQPVLGSALRAVPQNAAIPFLLARAQESLGQRDAALASYRRAYGDDPEMREATWGLARILSRFEQPRAAMGFAAALVREDPSDAEAARLLKTLHKKNPSLVDASEQPRHLRGLYVTEPRPAAAAPRIEVRLFSDAAGEAAVLSSFTWRCNTDFTLQDASGAALGRGQVDQTWQARWDPALGRLHFGPLGAPPTYTATAPLTLVPQSEGADFLVRDIRGPAAPGRDLGDRELRGALRIEPAAGGARLVLQSNLEDYVRDTLAEAAPPGTLSVPALEALAVLVRTQALRRLRAGGGPVCDSTPCGVFLGVQQEYPEASQAADETAGYALSRGGELAEASAFAACGGVSESTSDEQGVWDMPAQPLRSPEDLERFLLDPAPVGLLDQAGSSHEAAAARWTRVLDAKDVEARLDRMGLKGHLSAMVPGRRDASGRLLVLRAVGSGSSLELGPERMEQALSPGTLRSTFFTIKTLARHGRPAMFLLFGAGTGDGVGLCRAGADGMAASGGDFKQILSHYFPGTSAVVLKP